MRPYPTGGLRPIAADYECLLQGICLSFRQATRPSITMPIRNEKEQDQCAKPNNGCPSPFDEYKP